MLFPLYLKSHYEINTNLKLNINSSSFTTRQQASTSTNSFFFEFTFNAARHFAPFKHLRIGLKWTLYIFSIYTHWVCIRDLDFTKTQWIGEKFVIRHPFGLFAFCTRRDTTIYLGQCIHRCIYYMAYIVFALFAHHK